MQTILCLEEEGGRLRDCGLRKADPDVTLQGPLPVTRPSLGPPREDPEVLDSDRQAAVKNVGGEAPPRRPSHCQVHVLGGKREVSTGGVCRQEVPHQGTGALVFLSPGKEEQDRGCGSMTLMPPTSCMQAPGRSWYFLS